MRTLETGPVAVEKRRRALRWTIGGLVAGFLVACGGSGGGDSDDSRDLRAAFDRLKPGMTLEDVIAAVGWPPNDGPYSWSDAGLLLDVGFTVRTVGGELLIDTAGLSGLGEVEIRRY